MIREWLRVLFHGNGQEQVLDAEYEPYREELPEEAARRQMDPEGQMAPEEQAKLAPYDAIYRAC